MEVRHTSHIAAVVVMLRDADGGLHVDTVLDPSSWTPDEGLVVLDKKVVELVVPGIVNVGDRETTAGSDAESVETDGSTGSGPESDGDTVSETGSVVDPGAEAAE